MEFICVIQVRLNSTRLPNKAILPLYDNKTVIDVVIERAKQLNFDKIILATGPEEKNKELLITAIKNKVEIVFGDEDNVLSRFYEISKKYPFPYIIRMTADNPFVDILSTIQIKSYIKKYDLDYAVMDGIPLGTACEIFTKKVLDIVYEKAETPYDKEHVTSYIINNQDEFKYKRFSTDEFGEYYKLRLTIDTNHDYRKMVSLVDYFKTNDIDFRKVIRLLDYNEVIKKYIMN